MVFRGYRYTYSASLTLLVGLRGLGVGDRGLGFAD